MAGDRKRYFQLRIEEHLEAIERILKHELPNVGDFKLTLVGRVQGNPEADIVLTKDKLPSVMVALARRIRPVDQTSPWDTEELQADRIYRGLAELWHWMGKRFPSEAEGACGRIPAGDDTTSYGGPIVAYVKDVMEQLGAKREDTCKT